MIYIDKDNHRFTGEFVDLCTEISMIIGGFYAILKETNREEYASAFKESITESVNDETFWALCDK